MKTAIKMIVSGILLVWVCWYLDLSSVIARLRQVQATPILAACLCMFAGQTLSALRWSWIARGLGIPVRFFRKVELYFMGMFLSLFLPSTIGGDVARAYALAHGRAGQGWAAAASVLLERANGVFGMTIIITSAMFILDVPDHWRWMWVTAAGLLWLGMFSYGWWSKYIPEMLSRWKALPLQTHAFRILWWKSILMSIFFQALVVQAHVFLGGAVGLDMPWMAYAFMVCLVALAAAIPVSFNGFGIREAGYIGLATFFGGSNDAAAAMAALWVVVLTLTALPGGIVLWRFGGIRHFQKQG